MDQLLSEQLLKAIQIAKGSHASNIVRSELALFVRAAKDDPASIAEVIDLLLSHVEVNRSNLVPALYALAKLADASDEARDFVRSKIAADFVEYYVKDEDTKVANNARVLSQVLQGAPLSKFEKPISQSVPAAVTYNISNSNFVDGSPNANLNLQIQNYETYDHYIQELLNDLKNALENKNKTKVAEILQFLLDKGFDLLVALLSGQILKG